MTRAISPLQHFSYHGLSLIEFSLRYDMTFKNTKLLGEILFFDLGSTFDSTARREIMYAQFAQLGTKLAIFPSKMDKK